MYVMVIGIQYNESDPSTYEGVRLGEKIFQSGNFVKDWYDAKKYYLDHHSEEPLAGSSTVDHFIMDGAEYDSTYLHVENGVGVLKYPQVEDLDYWSQVDGWEYFVPKGTKPTWQELKEMCK